MLGRLFSEISPALRLLPDSWSRVSTRISNYSASIATATGRSSSLVIDVGKVIYSSLHSSSVSVMADAVQDKTPGAEEPVKTAKQLKKEAQKKEKMEKFLAKESNKESKVSKPLVEIRITLVLQQAFVK